MHNVDRVVDVQHHRLGRLLVAPAHRPHGCLYVRFIQKPLGCFRGTVAINHAGLRPKSARQCPTRSSKISTRSSSPIRRSMKGNFVNSPPHLPRRQAQCDVYRRHGNRQNPSLHLRTRARGALLQPGRLGQSAGPLKSLFRTSRTSKRPGSADGLNRSKRCCGGHRPENTDADPRVRGIARESLVKL